MTTNALVKSGGDIVSADTGVVVHDMASYLSRLSGTAAIQEQKQLAAAYDSACAALIGPNDVQVEGGRTFKKKSAWRKLARHFGISTAVMNVQKESVGEVFLATVTVRASAPWGQYAESVGACGTDEATGRRVITTADAIATAETRATNRAVSNLVAMGEVSAEEMNKGQRHSSGSVDIPRPTAPNGTPEFRTMKMPIGKSKGTLLMDLDTKDLESAIQWAAEKGKFEDLQAAGEKELEYRASHTTGPARPLVQEPETEETPF